MADAYKLIHSELWMLTELPMPSSVYYVHAYSSDSRVKQTATVAFVTWWPAVEYSETTKQNKFFTKQAVYVY